MSNDIADMMNNAFRKYDSKECVKCKGSGKIRKKQCPKCKGKGKE